MVAAAITGDWAGKAKSIGEDAVEAAGKLGVEVTTAGGLFKKVWHHNEVMGVMESLDPSVHKPEHKHTGGVKFWEIVHGKDYEGWIQK